MSLERDYLPYVASDLGAARVLVLAPHPDDESLGCGGSIALHRRRGDPVCVVFVSSGDRGDWSREGSAPATAERREGEAGRALSVLGVDDWELWRLPDRGVEAGPDLEARIASAVDAFAATLVYAPSPLEPHPDHRAVADSVRAALHGRSGIRIAWYEVGFPLPPNTLVDVSAVWSVKAEAVRCYRSQLEGHDYLGRIEGLARYRGLTLGDAVTHAEAFRVRASEASADDPVWRWRSAQEASLLGGGDGSARASLDDPSSRAQAEIVRLRREVEARESLIRSMRETRLWRLRERLRRLLGRAP